VTALLLLVLPAPPQAASVNAIKAAVMIARTIA
jgi:hypothetical protein